MTAMLSAQDAARHLEPGIWSAVTRHWLSKAIAELSHELVLEPRLLGAEAGVGRYVLVSDDGTSEYRFSARVLQLEHWVVEPSSIQRFAFDQEQPLNALAFLSELAERLKIPKECWAEYLEEVSSTLSSAAHKRFRPGPRASALAQADFQTVETSMTEGHPIFIANNARLGFNARDYRAYAPEASAPMRMAWLAALSTRTQFASLDGFEYSQLIASELSEATRARFRAVLSARGLDPEAYLFLPVHPWQWTNRVAQLFAADLAREELVYLGSSDDQYQPQQSIRTAFNVSNPARHYVKTALSILNMGFTRGMSPNIAKGATAVNAWVKRLVDNDEFLRRTGFDVLREVAFIGYRHRYYEQTSARRYDPYRETLAALWRESPTPRLAPGERLMTMAALLHVDSDGSALAVELMRAAGLPAEGWLRAYLRAYLSPLVHCFYAHRLTFTPHCENVILVLENHVPVRILMKDIAEDIGVLNPRAELPEAVKHLALRVPDEVMTLVVFTDAFDCVFRFLAQILVSHGVCDEAVFWRAVAGNVLEYQRSHPEFAEDFARYDLFAPTFPRNCLNRLQLTNNRLMVDLNATDPGDSLQFVGTLSNPIAPFAPERARALSESQP